MTTKNQPFTWAKASVVIAIGLFATVILMEVIRLLR